MYMLVPIDFKSCFFLMSVHLVKKVVVEVSLIEHCKVLFVGLSEVQINNTVKREVNNPTQISGVYDLFIPCLRHLKIFVTKDFIRQTQNCLTS